MLLSGALCFNSPKIFPLGLLREKTLSFEGLVFLVSGSSHATVVFP